MVKMNKRLLYQKLNSGIEYLIKYQKYFDNCMMQYQNGNTQCVTYIEWYVFIETFINSNKSILYNFNQIFSEMSEKSSVLIDNSEFPEDQILLPYQILLKSLIN